MQMSLFDALHMKDDVEFSEKEKITIIQHTAQGLQYLHDCYIAHCDMKSQNILLSYKPDDKIPVLVVKITDFGLSMMKNNADTSSSEGGEYVRNIGTPRYSSPENLRGELLNVKSLMMSDIYSYSLVVFEVICEDEPFYNLNYQQLKKQVGELRLLPDIPNDISISPSVFRLMKKCWDRDASKRPNAKQFVDQALRIDHLYEQN
jgi:serine/threonine protein kinase